MVGSIDCEIVWGGGNWSKFESDAKFPIDQDVTFLTITGKTDDNLIPVDLHLDDEIVIEYVALEPTLDTADQLDDRERAQWTTFM